MRKDAAEPLPGDQDLFEVENRLALLAGVPLLGMCAHRFDHAGPMFAFIAIAIGWLIALEWWSRRRPGLPAAVVVS